MTHVKGTKAQVNQIIANTTADVETVDDVMTSSDFWYITSDSEESASKGRLRRSDQPLKRPAQQARLAHHQGRCRLSASEWRHDVIISSIRRRKPPATSPSDALQQREGGDQSRWRKRRQLT